jgi:DNA-binding response OmpR family regulator
LHDNRQFWDTWEVFVSTDGLHIVIVEDNVDARDMLEMFLTLDGHQVEGAGDGISGLAAIVGSRPDVALIDIGLPKLDGYEVARQARVHLHADTKLIALTGYDDVRDKLRAQEAGFDAHLVKPVEPTLLTSILRSIAKGESGNRA